MGKLPYLSGPWFAMLDRVANDFGAAGAAAGLARDFTLIEHYPDGPADVAGDGMDAGFRIAFRADGSATVRPGAKAGEHADCFLEMDFQAARAVVSQPSGDGLDGLLQSLIESGRLKPSGDMTACPVDLFGFHDAVVDATSIA